ncbi:Mobile element protein [Arthrobacter sp. DR-2P]|nr:Mobile element protein [Arthrobacter sp. DR-2P]
MHEQGLDAVLAVLRLSLGYSAERVEAACRLALTGRVRSPRYAHLQPILATEQDKAAGLRLPGMNRLNTAATYAAPNTTQVVPSERDRYRNQAQAP